MNESQPPAAPGHPDNAARRTEMPAPADAAAGEDDSIWSTELPRPPAPGVTIGKYKLLEEIGEGGCGVVFMAEQLEPVRRRVAVKIIRLGMDTQQVIARFEAERQALAVMDHPNIAKVLDAGATETGRPYFVMELIRGVPLVKFCDDNRLGVRERLQLFIQVCAAVQHAHQKGIIHRDLKPSNVLVTLHDGVPVPKVIDFGIAKATQQPLTDRTLYTAHMEFIGTPAYMSPEQAELSGLDIDTRSDIYSLGVVLYELLTGQTPFSAEDLHNAGLDEMRRRIREVEPQTASTRLRTLMGAALTTAAMRRGTTPPKLLSLVRGDLDWIVMKCLEKDRTRRYDSAATLAQDLQRFLAHEPVSASPPSTIYKLAKFAQRHRPALAGASAFVLVLLGATVVSLREARRADREAQQAVASLAVAEEQRALAERNRLEAERQRQAVIIAYNQADFGAALDRLAADNPNDAAAFLTQALRAVPDNRAASGLLNSLLMHGNWAVPLSRFKAAEAGAALDVSPDGRTVITGGASGGARIWDIGTGQPLTPPLAQTAPITRVHFSPDSRRALTFEQAPPQGRGRGAQGAPGAEPVVRIWNTTTGQPVAALAQASGAPQSFVFNHDGSRVASASGRGARGQLRVWDAGTGQIVVARPLPGDGAAALEFSPDGAQLAVSAGNVARVLDAATLQPAGPPLAQPAEENGRAPRVLATGFSPDGSRVFIVSNDDTVQLWDAAAGQPVFSSPLRHDAVVAGAAFSPDGRWLVTFSADRTARVWDAATGEPLGAPLRHEAPVVAAAFSPDGTRIVTVAGENARVWDARTGRALTAPVRHENALRAAAFTPDGGRIVTTGRGGSVRVWEAALAPPPSLVVKLAVQGPSVSEPGGILREDSPQRRGGPGRQNASGNRGGPRRANFGSAGESLPRLWTFSPDASRLAVIAGRGAQVFDAATGAALSPQILPEVAGPALAVNFSPDGKTLVISAGATARIWDATTGRPAGPPMAHEGRVVFANFSGDGRRIVTVSQEPQPAAGAVVRVWDAVTGEALGDAVSVESGASLAALDHDGARVAVADYGYNVRIYDVQSGQSAGLPFVFDAPVSALAFGPGGGRLLTASGGTARVWDAASGQPVSAPMVHENAVMLAVFDADGRRVLTATDAPDNTARVWDAATGLPAALPFAWEGAGAAAAAAFSPGDGDVLVAARDNTVRAWTFSDAAAPDWLLDFAETLAQTRLDATRAPVFFNGSPLDALRAQAAASPAPVPPAARRAQEMLKAQPAQQ